jgi:cytosine/adenosine deaminase-related metal-dependent hydrolase
MRLDRWIRLVISERREKVNRSEAIKAGLRESAYNGVTTVGEIATAASDAYPLYGPGYLVELFAEVIGFSGARADSAYASLIQTLNSLLASSGAEVGISPHAPYTVSPQLLRQLVSLAKRRVLTLAMHLAESEEELTLLDAGTGPFQELLEERSMWDASAIPRASRPMDYLRVLAEAPRALVIHGNYLSEVEHEFMATNSEHMSLVYCPRTHAYFRHPRYPLEDLLRKNVRVAVGTDSRASNPDLSLLAEMQYVANEFPALPRHKLLHMATLAGAEALGREAAIGSITPGKLANLVAIPLPSHARGPADELLNAVLSNDNKPSGVWLNGNPINSSE